MIKAQKTKVAVIGATGFTGEKLVDILLSHPQVTLTYLTSRTEKDRSFGDVFPAFRKRLDLVCKDLDIDEAASKADVIFLSLPHKVSLTIAPLFLKKNKPVIDLSADYRLKNTSLYGKFYGIDHTDTVNLEKAVYGLPEFYREAVRQACLIANPGCYPTATILSLAPLLKEGLISDIIVDAKSGITGAGRKASLDHHFAHLNGNMFGYKPFNHQHLPEMTQILSEISGKDVQMRFTPHVIPVERGIMTTIYAKLVKEVSESEINDIYQACYAKEPFIRYFASCLPQLKNVIGSNFCDIGFAKQGRDILIIGAIDNLIKGAAGQAVQNMNIMLGFDETAGLC